MNPLVELHHHGQSFWYDNIRRGLITSGDLQRMIERDGLRGMTSNPTIFEKAIGGSADYDEAIRQLVGRGLGVPEIYEALAVADIQMAADLFRSLYDRDRAADGYVCLEVSPKLAHDTDATIAEAERLWRRVGRPNVMIKVPSTPAGIPAIEHLIGAGINVNVTLMFSMETYDQVAEAYIRGLEKRARAGRDVTRLGSVASLFVSRVDTAVDRLLKEKDAPQDLFGKTAIANSRLLYQRFKELFHGDRFAALRGRGARPQRLLWASTSTKNPAYRDVLYAEALIGPETVDTMPDATVAAFRDHGIVSATLEDDIPGCRRTIERLAQAGIDLGGVLQQLQDDGVRLFAESFDKLMETLAAKRTTMQKVTAFPAPPAHWHESKALDEAALKRVEALTADAARRLWERDTSLWKDDPAVAEKIANRLGWLRSPAAMRNEAAAITRFASEVREAGFTHALLLGMGGSSLCPEVCRNTFGVAAGYPDLGVIDTTDPRSILAAERSVDLSRTLFINASKSGTTIESVTLAEYFFDKVKRGDQFVAITDPGTVLDREGTQRGFRAVYRNAPDIGGRYAALSYFGLLPAALIGVDVAELLRRAAEGSAANSPGNERTAQSGIVLGALLAELAAAGRDKLTFLMSPQIADFGNWVEQLVAESTGKEGKGLVPVVGEPAGPASVYGNDRVFVAMLLGTDDNSALAGQLEELERAGHPVYRLWLKDTFDLGAEFFRWEVATAICGAAMKINPFDEPNVTESKENTARLLKQYESEGRLPGEPGERVASARALVQQARPGDYIAILAFLEQHPVYAARLRQLRARLRDATRLATTVGFGPRYLHSTGQLHKGGPNNGVFIFLTADDVEDAPIPGRPYSFGTLKRAQALGDLEALRRRGRRVVHLHLGRDVEAGLDELLEAVTSGALAAD